MNRSEKREAAYTLQRVVTIPEADPSTAWNTFAQRQEEMRRARAKPQKYIEMAPRTFAQTGMRASSGRIKAVRRSLPTYHTSPIPTRSGRRAGRRGWIWKVLSLFAICVLLVLAANFALTSNAFRIAQVSVTGTHNDALVHTIQGMGMQGQNIFLLNVAALTERIEAIPFVASASLSKQLPNQLSVAVVERTPMLLWQNAQGTYSIDDQGVVIAPLSETAGAEHLSMVIDKSNYANGHGQQIHPGMHLNQANIQFAADAFERLPRLTGITMFKLYYDGTMYGSTTDNVGGTDSKGSYIVESPSGWQAYLGNASDANPLNNKLLELQQILTLAQNEQLNLATIDLRYGLRPVYTLKS
jgi:cell division septal protein FtsQ